MLTNLTADVRVVDDDVGIARCWKSVPVRSCELRELNGRILASVPVADDVTENAKSAYVLQCVRSDASASIPL